MVMYLVSIRKLQQTGGKNGSSFLVILPKKWVERHGLEKGDPVVVAEREDGCLIIDPRVQKVSTTKKTTAQMQDNLRWIITSKYLLGFDEIRIVSEEPITNEQRLRLKEIIKRFVALEVTEEDDYQIVIQCLVDPTTLPVRKAIKRVNLIASRMLNDAIIAYFEGDPKSAEAVIERDEDVDRLFFLIVRELRSAIQYPRMAEEMGINPVEALDLRLASQYIERIADLAVEIASRTQGVLDKKLVKKIGPIAEKVKEMFNISVINLFKFDTEKVSWVIRAEKTLIKETASLRQHLITNPSEDTQTHLYVVDCLLRIGEAAKDIVDLGLPQD